DLSHLGQSLSDIRAELGTMYIYAKQLSSKPVLMTSIPWKGAADWSVARQFATEKVNDWIKNHTNSGYVIVDVYTALADKANPSALDPRYGKDGVLNTEGKRVVAELLQAALLPSEFKVPKAPENPPEERVYGPPLSARPTIIAPPVASVSTAPIAPIVPINPSTLGKYVTDGDPAAIVSAYQKNSITQKELVEAFDSVFATLHNDSDFRLFLRSKREYVTIARPAVTLNSSSSERDRTLITKAVEEFLDQKIQRRPEDFSPLSDPQLKLVPIKKDGTLNATTLAALSVLFWRARNQILPSAKWSEPLFPAKETKPTPPTRLRIGSKPDGSLDL
ncbi:hypothetical protein HZC07_00850, partial [Candidatus Micrarchaeota archaeon]|nr:hypothetical protein [Candidatus Micrarchaeota archaeon]